MFSGLESDSQSSCVIITRELLFQQACFQLGHLQEEMTSCLISCFNCGMCFACVCLCVCVCMYLFFWWVCICVQEQWLFLDSTSLMAFIKGINMTPVLITSAGNIKVGTW